MKFNFGKSGDIQVKLVVKGSKDYENKMLDYLLDKEIFEAKAAETYLSMDEEGKGILFLGLGEEKDLSLEILRKGFHKLGSELRSAKVESLGFSLPDFDKLDEFEAIKAATEGLLHSTYAFDKYLSEKKVKPTIEEVFIDVEDEALAKKAVEEAEIVMEGIILARDLVNERPMNMYPQILADAAKDNLEPLGVEVTIYGQDEIEDMGMEAFLSVSIGSDSEPKFIVMEYKGDEDSDETIALVGKGLTFDSGGYSLKPSASMDTMFSDMAGSATVIGALQSIAKAGLKKNVVAVVAACENLIDGSAYKPGDIIGSMSGKTIEVLNTDAEGRLTLADALWYTVKELKADKIIDLATLTGAAIVALGDLTTAAITNNDELLAEVIEASKLAGEPIWELPNFSDYKEYFSSDFADMANTNTKSKGAGTVTAGLFLENFVEDTPWVHLDIAGTAYLSSHKGYLPKGATGVHVKTLFNLIKA